MKNKHFRFFAALMLLTTLSACADSSVQSGSAAIPESEISSSNQQKEAITTQQNETQISQKEENSTVPDSTVNYQTPSGVYLGLCIGTEEGIWLTPRGFSDGVDECIEKWLASEYKYHDTWQDYKQVRGSAAVFSSDRTFELHTQCGDDRSDYIHFSGTYSMDDSHLALQYSKCNRYHNDMFQYSVELDYSEYDVVYEQLLSLQLNDANERGILPNEYFKLYPPSANSAFSIIHSPLFPCFDSTTERGKVGYQLCCVDDFLCREVYGCTINKSYKPNSPFSIQYSFNDAQEQDPNYEFYTYPFSPVISEKLQEALNDENTVTNIQFSDGKWVWTNSKGETINQGAYQESSSHPGLIVMYFTDDSIENCDNYIILLYITEKTIFYPAFLKYSD